MVKINNVQIYPELPYELTIDGTEEFNKGAIKLDNLTNSLPFDDYSDIEITINGTTYNFIQEIDNPNRISKGKTSHQIQLIEPVLKLDEIQIPDRAFSTTKGIQATWKYHIETVIETSDLDYELDTTTASLLNVTANNQVYSGSFLSLLVIAFRAVNLIPNLNGLVIGHNRLDEKKNDISTQVQTILEEDEVEKRQYQANTNDYASSTYSKIKNGSYEANEEIGATYFPSKRRS